MAFLRRGPEPGQTEQTPCSASLLYLSPDRAVLHKPVEPTTSLHRFKTRTAITDAPRAITLKPTFLLERHRKNIRMLRLGSLCCVSLTSLSLLPVHVPGGDKNPGITPADLTALLEKARTKHDVPALAAAILRGDAKPCLAVVGVRRRGDEALAMADDQWHLGSNTKPMTALLIALLIEMGLLDWDTPLEQIFPEHADQWHADLKKITPQHLLTHTSGLPGLGPLNWFLLGGTDGSPLKDRERAVKSLDTIKLTKKPGERYEYSNLGRVFEAGVAGRDGIS